MNCNNYNDLVNEFMSSAFEDDNETISLPYCQAVRGEGKNADNLCGLFIPESQVLSGNWIKTPDENLKVIYPFGRGKEKNNVSGYLFQSPRLLVCPKSPILEVSKNSTLEGREIIGLFNKAKKRAGSTNQRLYWMFFLDKNNQLLHHIPYRINARSTFGATFGQQLAQFYAQYNIAFTSLLSKQTGKTLPIKARNAMLTSLWVFCPRFSREEAGEEITSIAIKCVSFEVPTPENVMSLFAGTDDDLKMHVLAMLNPLEMAVNILPPSNNKKPALPPVVTEAYAVLNGDGDDYDDMPTHIGVVNETSPF